MRGRAKLDFGAFPGASDASISVAAPEVTSDTIVNAWLYPKATADHSVDEHHLAPIRVSASACTAGVGFTIRGVVDAVGQATRTHGQWFVAWSY